VFILHGTTTVEPPWGQYAYYEEEKWLKNYFNHSQILTIHWCVILNVVQNVTKWLKKNA
jgi:hypothetical protein